MFKFLFIIILVLLPIKVGVDIQKKMHNRKKNLKELDTFFSNVKREVIFSKRKISEIFYENLPCLSGRLRQDFEDNLTSLPEIGLYEFFNKLNIDSNDKKLLLSFADGIPKHEESFDNLLKLLEENYHVANNIYKQNGKLYRSIGLASGLILGILFI